MDQFEMDLGVPIDNSKLDANPMVKGHGYGPEGKRCKPNGPGSDHRVNWAACSKFEEDGI